MTVSEFLRQGDDCEWLLWVRVRYAHPPQQSLLGAQPPHTRTDRQTDRHTGSQAFQVCVPGLRAQCQSHSGPRPPGIPQAAGPTATLWEWGRGQAGSWAVAMETTAWEPRPACLSVTEAPGPAPCQSLRLRAPPPVSSGREPGVRMEAQRPTDSVQSHLPACRCPRAAIVSGRD
jgi:hypothetical protein